MIDCQGRLPLQLLAKPGKLSKDTSQESKKDKKEQDSKDMRETAVGLAREKVRSNFIAPATMAPRLFSPKEGYMGRHTLKVQSVRTSASSRARIALCALVAFSTMAIATSSNTYGQDLSSRFQGSVTDETGGRVPGAAVTLTNEQTNAVQDTLTNDVGTLCFSESHAGGIPDQR